MIKVRMSIIFLINIMTSIFICTLNKSKFRFEKNEKSNIYTRGLCFHFILKRISILESHFKS